MDTGRAGTIGAVSFDDMIGKSFFAKNDLLPRGYALEAIHEWPTPDHQFPPGSGGSIAFDKSLAKVITPVGNNQGAFGWNFGADYAKALIVVGGTMAIRFRTLLAIQDGAPSNNALQSANGLAFWNERFLLKFTANSFSSAGGWFGGNTTLQTANVSAFLTRNSFIDYRNVTMALFVDTDAAVMKCFLRYGRANWVEVMTQSTSFLAAVRTASIMAHVEGNGSDMRFTTPIGVYAGN